MFWFQGGSPAAKASHTSSCSSSGPREFLAVKAARWLGDAAQKAGASIKRLAVRPSAEGLKQDLESRARSAPEALELALTEWARQLAEADTTPGYESKEGEPRTFRSIFLESRAFELCLATAASGIAAGRPCSSQRALVDCPAWRTLANCVTLAGTEDLALKLPEVLAETASFPACRRWAEEVVAALKNDAFCEVLKSRRTASADNAEQLRSSIRTASSPLRPQEVCRISLEAVRQYAVFRAGLNEAVSHLQELRSDRESRLQVVQRCLGEIESDALVRMKEAAQRREALLSDRESALAGPRQALQDFEKNIDCKKTETIIQEMEERRRKLLAELEEASQELAKEQECQLTLLQARENVVAEYRQQRDLLEHQLKELRPTQFYGVKDPRAAAMTESEIVASLKQATAKLSGLAKKFHEAGKEAISGRSAEVKKHREANSNNVHEALQAHARREVVRVEVVASNVAHSVTSLLDVAMARAHLLSRGVSPEAEGSYSLEHVRRRPDMQLLRAALASMDAAWSEATNLWEVAQEKQVGFQGPFAEAKAQTGEAVMQALEEARGRITSSLASLQSADPNLYDLAFAQFGSDDLKALPESVHEAPEGSLPHGWEVHSTEEGHVYYYSLVTGQTQWEVPDDDAAVSSGWRLFQAEDGGWFYHNPYNGEGVWYPDLPDYAAVPDSLDALRQDASSYG